MSQQIELNCVVADQVHWNDKYVASEFPVVHMWRVHLPSIFSFIEEMNDYLDEQEQQKSKRYHFEHDSKRYIVSRAVIKTLIAEWLGISWKEIRIIAGPNKKPIIKDTSKPVHFNLTHSGDFLLLAISSSEVGIDIEEVDTSLDFDDIMDHTFSDVEKQAVKTAMNAREMFYFFWTRKEAISKATSKGITDDYRRTICLNGLNIIPAEAIGSELNWALTSFYVRENYIATIAALPDTPIQFHDFVWRS